jgi:tRNA-Thr(GGU) m(6)t(6)A37 methyltransferase TsaA
MKDIRFRPIGVIRTRFKKTAGMPIQPRGAGKAKGTIELRPEYGEGLRDLSGFSHVVLLYHFHKAKKAKLLVTPFMDTEKRGVFATRAPSRPNAIGLSIVRLVSVEGATLTVEGIDVLDGTPLLDIKPFVPEFDTVRFVKTGWLGRARRRVARARSDDRFTGRRRR